jgi:hypothetical protein
VWLPLIRTTIPSTRKGSMHRYSPRPRWTAPSRRSNHRLRVRYAGAASSPRMLSPRQVDPRAWWPNTTVVAYPPIGAPANQGLNRLLEDHPVGYARAVTTQRVAVRLPFGQQGFEQFPDGLDDVWLDGGHGHTPSRREASRTPRMIGYTVSALQTCANRDTAFLLARALSGVLT